MKPTLAYSFFFRTVSHINVLKALTLLLHAGSLWCFQHPPSSDMDYRIFGVRTVVFSHTGDLRQSRYLLLSRNRSHLLFLIVFNHSHQADNHCHYIPTMLINDRCCVVLENQVSCSPRSSGRTTTPSPPPAPPPPPPPPHPLGPSPGAQPLAGPAPGAPAFPLCGAGAVAASDHARLRLDVRSSVAQPLPSHLSELERLRRVPSTPQRPGGQGSHRDGLQRPQDAHR